MGNLKTALRLGLGEGHSIPAILDRANRILPAVKETEMYATVAAVRPTGALTRVDPRSNTIRQRIAIPPGSYNPLFSDGMIWITRVDSNVLTVVDASSVMFSRRYQSVRSLGF